MTVRYGDRVLASFATVGRAVGASLGDFPAGATVVDAKGRPRAVLSHVWSLRKQCMVPGWIMAAEPGGGE